VPRFIDLGNIESIPSHSSLIDHTYIVVLNNMAKDDPSIPAWQKAASTDRKGSTDRNDSDTQPDPKPPSAPETLPTFEFKHVKEMPPVPTRAEAAQFLEHPGTKAATVGDKIAFLELKGVQRADIEALVPEAKKHYAAVSPTSLLCHGQED
jgi:hypothetical protein